MAKPNVKSDAYQKALLEGKKYLELHYPDGWKPESEATDPSELLYSHAMSELEAFDEAIKTLNAKCLELMKLLIAVVGAVVTAWKIFSSSTNPAKHDETSNWFAIAAILFFVYAMSLMARCLRSHDHIPTVTTHKLLDWAGEDREHPSYLRIRAAVTVERILVGNREVNTYLSERLDAAWCATIIGFLLITISLAFQFI
jgi:hypothetical protein